MLAIINFLKALKENKKGQGMVEYALIIGLIAVVVIVVLVVLGEEIKGLFGGVATKIQGVQTPSVAP